MTDLEFDRNQTVMAFASLAHAFGWEVGFRWIVDDTGKETGNILLFVNTPWEVFRWELKPYEMLGHWAEYTGKIPEYDVEPNIQRMKMMKMIETLLSVKREKPKVEEPPPAPIPQEKPEQVKEVENKARAIVQEKLKRKNKKKTNE